MSSHRVLDLSTKRETHPQECEVRVDVKEDGEWVRIPVTLCELHINKDGPADITRTAKVKFPAEWGGRDITQYINGFNSQTPISDENAEKILHNNIPAEEIDTTPYDECRIWFYDGESNRYEIEHYGYVGGIGPAAETGVMKFWVYDAADLMRRVKVSKSFGEPTIQQVLDFAVNGKDDLGNPVGIANRSVFSNVGTYIAGVQEVTAQKVVEERAEEEVFSSIGEDVEFVIEGTFPVVGALQLPINDVVEDIFDFAKDNLLDPLLTGQKRFEMNRNNMVDLMDWFCGEIGGKWHFEPTPDGPVLFIDNTSSEGVKQDSIFGVPLPDASQKEDGELSRRMFVDHEITEESNQGDVSDFTDRETFATVSVLDNNALYDIKPFNTLELYGESSDPTDYLTSNANYTSASQVSRRYPYVKVQYPPLISRSGGYEYSAPPVESDKITLDRAKREAIDEFRQHLTESTEGTIELKGEPHILPFDFITAVPVCNEIYPNVELPPITYEVNSVLHRRAADGRYTSELGVSLIFDESKLVVNAEYRNA